MQTIHITNSVSLTRIKYLLGSLFIKIGWEKNSQLKSCIKKNKLNVVKLRV